ncbi:hypothetical protein [Stutzerimonas stutzeri]|uniref:hypothetical protein n=1 Tax=Stutzerimonas stutzeri TaxID=316 RepID=UPI00210E3C0A|nr:hypothetical protein [Stutzerimonas stutzeri]MCQ4321834.1 hypothetical protein [Stutzerimonas stutzeri]
MSIYLGMLIDCDTSVRPMSGQLDGAIVVFLVSPLLRADSLISIRATAGFIESMPVSLVTFLVN